MKVKLRVFICLFLVYSICLSNPLTVMGGSKILGVDDILQQESNWCWAAAAYAVGYWESDRADIDAWVNQRDIVRHVKGRVANLTATVFEAENAVEYVTDDNIEFDSSILPESFSNIMIYINERHPVMAFVWDPFDSGHAYVITGYRDTDVESGRYDRIYVMDPLIGDTVTVDFFRFEEGSWDDSRPWAHSITYSY